MKQNVFHELLDASKASPVLLDIGASQAPPSIWNGIAQRSTYIGFDPDIRDMPQPSEGRYHRTHILPKAIVANPEQKTVKFFLTSSPYCSSTLAPDHPSLANYLFADLFGVIGEEEVEAISLDAALNQLSLDHIDWFKTDSQGTDLRLFESLKMDIRSRILAVDIEPGLIDVYCDEDLFHDAHKKLTQDGFWLSRLDVLGSIRMRPENLAHLTKINKSLDVHLINRYVRNSPGWCEARYLRTIDWLTGTKSDGNRFILLWIFSILDEQYGFAIDLVVEYERRFGAGHIAKLMFDETIRSIKSTRWRKSAIFQRYLLDPISKAISLFRLRVR